MPMYEIQEPDLLSSIIIGCGDIAGGYDEATSGINSLTHAGAYSRSPAFKVAACIEPNEKRRKAFMDYWNVPEGFENINTCIETTGMNFDVASVCTPTATHADILKNLLHSQVRLVFSEKPITENIEDARRLVGDYDNVGKPLVINYLRRWDPIFKTLKESIASGHLGEVQSVTARYVNGLLNGGSHVIDLIQHLLGPIQAERVNRIIPDGLEQDPTIDAILRTGNRSPVYLCGADFRNYSIFEIDILCTEGRAIITELGNVLTLQQVNKSQLFPGYKVLGQNRTQVGSLSEIMDTAIKKIHAFLVGNQNFNPSTSLSALATQETCNALIELVKLKDRK